MMPRRSPRVRGSTVAGVVLATAACAAPSGASAAAGAASEASAWSPPAERTATSTVTGSSTVALRTSKRPTPDLDGRPPPPPDAGDVLIWIPRVVFAPVHLVTEWGIRRPLGFVLTIAERDGWADLVIDFFTFEDRKIGIIPTFFLDFDFRPSVGVYFFWNELFVKPHSIRLVAAYGGEDWLHLGFVDRWELGESFRFEAAVDYLSRPDYIFTGVGPDTDVDVFQRYLEARTEGAGRVRVDDFWRASELRVEGGVRRVRFASGDPDEDDGELDLARPGAPRPEGFDTGYTSAFQRGLFRLDTRLARPAPGSGVYVEGRIEHGWDIEDPGRYQWLRTGASAGAFLDLGQYRTVGLSGQLDFADPLGDRTLPFTELVHLGRRPQDLSAFLPGVLIGRSAAILTAEYRYPVWVFLDGSLQYSVGNVFGAGLEDFELGALRSSLGIGIQGTQDPDNMFTFQFALGTSRFDEPFAIDSVRVVFGTQTGF